MKHYIDDAGDVLGFDDNQPVPSGLREITVEEARAAYAAKLAALAPDPEQVKQARIAELKQFLRDTDYVALPDYDKDKPEVLAQRQAARDEIRDLET